MANSNIAIKTTQFKRGLREVLEARLIPEDLGILLAGEPAFETDTGQLKIGNGKDSYKDLPYVGSSTGNSESYTHTSEEIIDGKVYQVFWKIIPTDDNQVSGVTVDPTTGKLCEVFSDKKTYYLHRYLTEDSFISTSEIDILLN